SGISPGPEYSFRRPGRKGRSPSDFGHAGLRTGAGDNAGTRCPVYRGTAVRCVMPPCPIDIGPAPVDINILHVNVGPRVIDPPRAVPAVIDNAPIIPVKVHGQPAPDQQTQSKVDERRSPGDPSLGIDNGGIVLRDV